MLFIVADEETLVAEIAALVKTDTRRPHPNISFVALSRVSNGCECWSQSQDETMREKVFICK